MAEIQPSDLDCRTFAEALELCLKLTGAGYEMRLNRVGPQWIAEFGKCRGTGTTPTTALVNAAKLLANPNIRVEP